MEERWLHLKEIWHKALRFFDIDVTEMRRAMVLMPVDMKHRGAVIEGILECGSNCVRTHHGADRWVVLVVIIGEGKVGLCKDAYLTLGPMTEPACDESDPLCRK